MSISAQPLSPADLGFGRLFAAIRDAVIVADVATGRIVLWNLAAEQIFGHSASEAADLPLEALVPDRLKGRHSAGFARYRQTGHGRLIEAGRPFEVPAVRKDGAEIAVELTLSPIQDAPVGGRFVLAIVRDVSERKSEEETAQRLATIVESSEDAILGYTLEGVLTSWNPGAERLFGYAAREVVGQSVDRLVPPERPDELPDILARLRRGERIEHYETQRVRKDGQRLDVSLSISPVRDATGQIVGAASIAHDITERKQAEEERARLLRQAEAAEAKFRGLLEGAPDSVVISGQDGQIALVNRQTERLFGYSRDELLGQPVELLVPERLRAVHAQDRASYQVEPRTRPMGLGMELFARRKDGSEFPVEISLSPVPSDAGLLAIASIRDITERKRAEEERVHLAREQAARVEAEAAAKEVRALAASLEQRVRERTAALEAANAELSAFSYSVSHDLRAPLRAIDGFSQVLLEDYTSVLDEAGQDALRRVRAASQRMGELIDDLLQLSRVSLAPLRRKPVDLGRLAREVAGSLQQTAPEREVEWVVPPELVVDGDARLLRGALENLLGNAFKFTGKQAQARIEVGVGEQGGEVVYFVRDNGAGFDMAYADRLFGAFQRLHAAAEFEGTGIGLATVQRIIHRHGGRIWAHSAGPGQGATFYFTLGPARAGSGSAGNEKKEEEEDPA
jgi:PAS domain S-box-containing protein